jgi:hypothetical protein
MIKEPATLEITRNRGEKCLPFSAACIVDGHRAVAESHTAENAAKCAFDMAATHDQRKVLFVTSTTPSGQCLVLCQMRLLEFRGIGYGSEPEEAHRNAVAELNRAFQLNKHRSKNPHGDVKNKFRVAS